MNWKLNLAIIISGLAPHLYAAHMDSASAARMAQMVAEAARNAQNAANLRQDSNMMPGAPEPQLEQKKENNEQRPVRKQKILGEQRIRPKNFQCADCGYRCRSKGSLENHVYTHTKERPHECGDCGCRFTQKSHLTRHKMVHIKPLLCECGKSFSRKNLLSNHQKTPKHFRLLAEKQKSPNLFIPPVIIQAQFADTQKASATLSEMVANQEFALPDSTML